MLNLVILQAEPAGVDSFVVFLAILLLVFPVLFIRNLLKGWRPGTTGGMFWKGLLIFSAPFYIGVVIIKFFTITGLISDDFGQLFPSLQQPSGNLPAVSGVDLNFWSEFTVGLMAAALISALSAILIYSFFKRRHPGKKKLGGLVFWAALYASAIIIANGAFDLIQESALEGQAKKTQQQQAQKNRQQEQEENADDLSRKIFMLGSSEDIAGTTSAKSYDEIFRQNKTETEIEMGELAKDVPDSVLEQFFRLTNQRVQALARQDPLACHYFFKTGTYLRRFRDLFQETNSNPEMAALLEALAREVNSPSRNTVTPKMDTAEYNATTGNLYDRVRTTIPEENQNFDVFDNPQRVVSKSEKTQGCFTYQAYVAEISNLPTEDAIRYYRALLEDRADALNAEAALAGNAGLLSLYQDLVAKGSPLDILFEDNPNLKKDFVLFLIENSAGTFEDIREKAGRRKKDLLDANIRYYFALATDAAIYGHISYHSTFLQQLSEDDPGLCGRMAGALEEVDASLLGTAVYKRHANALAAVMKSSRTNANEFPEQITGSVYQDTLDELEGEMRKNLSGARPDLDLLFYPKERVTGPDRARACRQAEAFYSALGRLGQRRAAAFFRTMMLEETS